MIVALDATNRVHALWRATGQSRLALSALAKDLRAIQLSLGARLPVAAFDRGISFRRDVESSYKSDRQSHPPDLESALAAAPSVATRAGWFCVAINGFEADDVLASAASLACERGEKCVLISPDKDMFQCLRAGRVSALKKFCRSSGAIDPGSSKWVTEASLRSGHGIGPGQWIDFQCLVGDAVDNIRGWAGVGEVTASKWLSLASLDEIISAPGEFPMTPAQREAMREFVPRLPALRKLVTLRSDLDISKGLS